MTERSQIFDRIRNSEAYANRASRAVRSTRLSAELGCGIVFISCWCLGAVAFTFIFFSFGGWLFAIIPALILLFGLGLLVHFINRVSRYSSETTQATPAIVVSKHSGSNGRHLRQHITLEFENGERKEYQIVHDKEAALLGVGDAGVAFTRADFLAFDRVR